MRRKRLWVLMLLVLTLVSGCTGTVVENSETLLIVGFTNGDEGQLALIENNVLQLDIPRLRWLPESVRDLPGLPLAADVVDRTGGRRALVVLSRDGGRSYLSIFNLQGLAPDQLDNFRETPPIALNDLPGREPRASALCPTRLQVSRDGRFAAILNEPSVCGVTGDIRLSIDVLELGQSPSFISHYEGVFPLVANALVLDQTDDTLYFLEQVAGGVQLKSLALGPLVDRLGTIGKAAIEAHNVQDMGIVLDSMVVLSSSNFATFENYRNGGDDAVLVTTTVNSHRLITSDFADIPQVMILGLGHFTVHLSATDTAQLPATLEGYQSGTVEALNGLVFLVGIEQAAVFDNLAYREGAPALTPISLRELGAPAFISWVAALAPPIP